jgi:CRP-like cAMP-binding protein
MDVSSLDSIPLFAALPRKERAVVAAHADEVGLEQGAHIVEEGALAYELFVIKSGTADVVHDGEEIARMGPGDVVGEIGVLRTHIRTATVVATSPIEAIVMYGPELTALRASMPHVWAELERLVEERTSDG